MTTWLIPKDLVASTELKTALSISSALTSTTTITKRRTGKSFVSPGECENDGHYAEKEIPLRSDMLIFVINLPRTNLNDGRLAMLLCSLHTSGIFSMCSPLQSQRGKNRHTELELQEQEGRNEGKYK